MNLHYWFVGDVKKCIVSKLMFWRELFIPACCVFVKRLPCMTSATPWDKTSRSYQAWIPAIIDAFSKPDKEPRCERTLRGRQKGKLGYCDGAPFEITLMPKIQVKIAVSVAPVRQVIEIENTRCTPATSASAGYLSSILKISCASTPVKKAKLRRNQIGYV